MKNKINFSVLGSGNGARAFCGQIAERNYPVMMYEPLEETSDYLKIKTEKEMFLRGNITAGGSITGATMDIEEAMEGADVIIVVVPSFAHKPIFKKMIPFLKENMHVILIPGNMGGFVLKKMMADVNNKTSIHISETSSLPYACRIESYNTVMIHKKKFKMKVATSPYGKSTEAVAIMNDIFKGYIEFFPGKNLLEVDLDNINYTLHPLPVLLNYGTIETKPDTFRHYMDGLTPLISEKMTIVDKERLDLGKKISLDLLPTLEQLKMYYGRNDATTYFEFVNSDDSPYKKIVGHHVKSRYITEDVPFLYTPILELAKLARVKMPMSELCMDLASELHNTDYRKEGTTLEKIGLKGKSIEEIIAIAS